MALQSFFAEDPKMVEDFFNDAARINPGNVFEITSDPEQNAANAAAHALRSTKEENLAWFNQYRDQHAKIWLEHKGIAKSWGFGYFGEDEATPANLYGETKGKSAAEKAAEEARLKEEARLAEDARLAEEAKKASRKGVEDKLADKQKIINMNQKELDKYYSKEKREEKKKGAKDVAGRHKYDYEAIMLNLFGTQSISDAVSGTNFSQKEFKELTNRYDKALLRWAEDYAGAGFGPGKKPRKGIWRTPEKVTADEYKTALAAWKHYYGKGEAPSGTLAKIVQIALETS